MVTLKDIAREAGVSVGTVSIVLGRNSAGQVVRPRTRERVQRAAAALGYLRNAHAESLVTGSTSVIGFLAWDFSNWHTAKVFEFLTEATEARGFLVKCFRQREGREEETARKVLEQRVAGVVIQGGTLPLHAAFDHWARTRRLPRMHLGVGFPGLAVPSVFTDDTSGCAALIAHLRDLGCRRVALAGTRRLGAGPFELRRRGFRDALERFGMDGGGADILDDDEGLGVEGMEVRLGALLARQDRPEAVCCTTDAYAAVALRAARRLGLAVPGQVAVTGFGDSPLAPLTDPPLTTVHQPFEALAQACLSGLFDQIDHPERSVTAPLPPVPVTLVIRGSTAGGPADRASGDHPAPPL